LKKNSLVAFLLFACTFTHAQHTDHLVKDLKCFDMSAFSSLDLLISSRESGEYVPIAEWSEKVTSNTIVWKIFPLEGGIQYVIVLTAEEHVEGTAIEIRNGLGEKLEYTSRLNDLDKNQINFFYTPPYDDAYQIGFRQVNSHKSATCMFMAVFEGDPDPQER
jgi:hypothetical protein